MSRKYVKIDLIGEGTFGRAWLVKRQDTHKTYVVKEIRVQGMSDSEKEQTLTEVKALAKCKHINVIRYREAYVENGYLCIAMEHADGGDLQKRIAAQKGKYLPEQSVIDWIIQVFFALKYIHGINLLHRDLKTQNIFLTKDNIVKVGDFGIARFLQNTQDHASTVIGTPYYLSPEICQKKSYNHKSDIWAAGCILYELCTLKHPFDGINISSLMVNILHGKFRPIPSHYGPLLEDLVLVLLHQNPEKRPTAEQVLSIPAVQPYANHYVKRTMTMREIQINTPSPGSVPPRTRDGSRDKENLMPGGKVRGSVSRPKSLGTPPRKTPLGDRQQGPSSADVRTQPKPRKSSGVSKMKMPPKVSLYHELLTKQCPGSRSSQNRSNTEDDKEPGLPDKLEPIKKDYPKIPKVCSITYTVKGERSIAQRKPQPEQDKKQKPRKVINPGCFNPRTEVFQDDSAISQSEGSSVLSSEPGNCADTSSGYGSSDNKGNTDEKNPNRKLDSKPKPDAGTQKMYKMMYDGVVKRHEEVFGKVETIKCFLEEKLGHHETTNYYSLIKDSVEASIEFNDIIGMLPNHVLQYFPLMIHAAQLEIFLR